MAQTEYRAYDSNHQLCKVARKDVGTTVFSNSVLGEVQWQAQGVTGGTNTDCASNATTATHADATKKVTFTYDNLGATWKANYVNAATPDLTYGLDNNGNLKTLTAGTVTQTYNYNSLNLLDDENLAVSGKSFALDYHYNAAGVRDWLQYPDGDKVTFTPNAFGEPTQAVRQARTGRALLSYASNATYYPTGTINTFNYGNGLSHKTTLNSRKVPGSIKDSKTGLTALHYSYSYDNNLNVTSISDNVSSAYSLTDLTYDGLDRLRTTTGNSGIGSSSLTYDGLGNIKTYSSKGRSLVYNYNTTDNRLTSVSGIAGKYGAFAYDDRGNIYGNGGKTFTYNRANQLISSGTNSYTYDGHNRRVKQTDSKGTSYSLYSQDGTLYYRETPAGGINYIYLGKKLIAKDGVIPENAGKQHFRPFGSSIEGEIDDAGYTGHKFDTDLGLSYMQGRYGDPIIGRFYSNDPVGYTAKNPIMSFNRYLYVNNNPYKYTDPNGEFLFLLPLIGALSGGYTAYQAAGDMGASENTQILAGLGGAFTGLLTGGTTAIASLTAKTVVKTAVSSSLALAGKVTAGAVTGAVSSGAGQAIGDTLSDLSQGKKVDVDKGEVALKSAIGAGEGILAAIPGATLTLSPAKKLVADAVGVSFVAAKKELEQK